MTERRTKLATRIAALSIAIAIATALLAGVLAVSLIRQSGTSAAQTTVGRLADIAQTTSENGRTVRAGRVKVRRALAGLKVRLGYVNERGRLRNQNQLVTAAVSQEDVAAVLNGEDVSDVRRTDLGTAIVEGRPTSAGGVFLVQRVTDANGVQNRAIKLLVLALLIASGVAALLGWAVGARLVTPLRRAADAAHALAHGRRDVSVPTDGPAEVAELSAAVNALGAALAQSEARQRDFLLSVSHDLRTPLTSIVGYAESLADGVVPPGEASEVGGVMVAEAQRLERLVGDLLDLARVGAQDLRLEFAAVDLAAIVGGAVRAWTARCTSAGVNLEAQTQGPVAAWTDAGRVRQVLDGLVENALRVTPAGAPIVMETNIDGRFAVLEVRDGGPGLTDDDLAVAFDNGELFRRYEGVRAVGTGLGLAIVHGLVTRLGGTVTASHAPERGARFIVRLPRRAEDLQNPNIG